MSDQLPTRFTIRVYALVISNRKEVLVTDEFQMGMKMTKFPGGGLHHGEGTIDCLKREMMEECNQEIEDIRHFYTSDFYQKSQFSEDHQLISIYYLAAIKGPAMFRASDVPFDFPDLVNGNQSFRWLAAERINPDEFTFPIDKHVAHLLKEYLSAKP